ncbi:hypothetical protein KCTCHS21_12580 [Cohnella abietis]|uniref:Uncharacterized protein n=1 Tax=Cohnella abietis TaxID=2507935 RepID=A0A3T1D1G4_9BACL|nr:hypothetical protein KCTCHS21_12580 [Cohnella abietis]
MPSHFPGRADEAVIIAYDSAGVSVPVKGSGLFLFYRLYKVQMPVLIKVSSNFADLVADNVPLYF